MVDGLCIEDSASHQRSTWRASRVLGIVGGVCLLTVLVVVGGNGDLVRRSSLQLLSGESSAAKPSLGGSIAAGVLPVKFGQQLVAGSNITTSATSNDTSAAQFTQAPVCQSPPPSSIFFVNELFWSWVHTLKVSNVKPGVKIANDKKEKLKAGDSEDMGYITSVPFSFTSQQAWKDKDGKLIARSHQSAITFVTNVMVTDCEGRALATISEVFSPTDSAVTQYTIQNPDGDILAMSTFSKNFGTKVNINDQVSGKRLVSMFKGWAQMSDAWVAEFRDGGAQQLANDPRIIVMLLAANSASGSWGLGRAIAWIVLNPLLWVLLCCCCCACCTAFSKTKEGYKSYDEIPSASGNTTGYGNGGAGDFFYGSTQYV